MRVPTRTHRPYMPDYGLSGEPDGLLPWFWAVDHLRSAQRFWVSSVDPLGEPYLSAVWAIWIDDAASIEPVSEAYLAKYGEGFPDPAENPLFAVLPDVVIGMVESEFSSRATRWTFVAAEVS